MKKLLSLIAFSLLLLVGCDDHSSILEPTNSYSEKDLSKGRPILIESSDNLIYTQDNGDIIGDLDEADDDLTTNIFEKADAENKDENNTKINN